ncbi:hypothetical protein JTE90_020445 [Oedothorax gibbosus]|uniref:Secreted protein n=1 Tax=Oedothorax gibbosus TaxID=931172 RepID=A0AAV6TZ37_9ARAC|nr:hypothetical protein JTE90_020445 [Oedothorax gibbosus]
MNAIVLTVFLVIGTAIAAPQYDKPQDSQRIQDYRIGLQDQTDPPYIFEPRISGKSFTERADKPQDSQRIQDYRRELQDQTDPPYIRKLRKSFTERAGIDALDHRKVPLHQPPLLLLPLTLPLRTEPRGEGSCWKSS